MWVLKYPFMWIDYAIRQGLHTAGTLLRQPGLLLATRAPGLSFPQHGETVISLTTFGPRMSTAVLCIASLLVASPKLPVILWLDREDYEGEWPRGLKRLVERGLQIRCSDGEYGPHTKYYGTFQEFAGTGTRIITVDDDMMYPRWFPDKLLNAADASPECVVAYRAHTIVRDHENGKLAPYKDWRPTLTTEPAFCILQRVCPALRTRRRWWISSRHRARSSSITHRTRTTSGSTTARLNPGT